jgi:uncharacterized protein YfaS (alpha-2-macroglobulin family)
VYPFSSFAMTNLSVQDPQRTLVVNYANLPTEIEPNSEATFEVSVGDSEGKPVEAELTLAAVDEGIHGITNYANPDPLSWLGRTRKPDFRRAHYYDKVAYDFYATPIGGDALLRDLQKRMPSADENWIKPVALWSGLVKTDTNGKVSINMSLPEFTGQLRLVAVASTPTQMGSNAGDVYVRRPCMLRTSVPRFMLPEDSAQSRVTVFNNTDAACKARVSWNVSGALVGAEGATDVEAAPHAESSFIVPFVSGKESGDGEIKWELQASAPDGKELAHYSETSQIPIRVAGHFQSHSETVMLNPGETKEFKNTIFLDDERSEIELSLSVSPLLRLNDALKFTVQYPYGCVEQTTSCLMPMYFLRKNAKLFAGSIEEVSNVEEFTRNGICRLISMQTGSGGLGMWPGDKIAYPYGSVYALHFLTMVKQDREIEVPEENFKALSQYVHGLATDWTSSDPDSLFLRSYALYVLALDGDQEALRQISRFDEIKVPRHARYLLAAAIAKNTHDRGRVEKYLASAPSSPYEGFETSGALNSDIRNKAVEFMALREIGVSQDEMAKNAKELLDFLIAKKHGSTQETAFIITALADYLSGFELNAQEASAVINSGDEDKKLSGVEPYHGVQTGPSKYFAVSNNGQASIFANFVSRGVPEKEQVDAKSEGGLSVSRDMMTKRGEHYTDSSFIQGDSYVVDFKIETNQERRNIVMVDMLPAGFEIENPRLDTNMLPGGVFDKGIKVLQKTDNTGNENVETTDNGSIVASYLDVRDDRIVVALDKLPEGEHHLYYVVRAVTPGAYQRPAATAECMYDGNVHANTVTSRIEVK